MEFVRAPQTSVTPLPFPALAPRPGRHLTMMHVRVVYFVADACAILAAGLLFVWAFGLRVLCSKLPY